MYANEILLAEDEPTDAKFFERALKKLDSPPSFSWCKNGEDAYVNLTQQRKDGNLPRLAILDIKMPGMNGLELLKKLKANPLTRDLPIIIMSSSDEPKDIAEAYDSGANGYLVKPNRFQDLRDLVNSICYFWIKTNRLRPRNLTGEINS